MDTEKDCLFNGNDVVHGTLQDASGRLVLKYFV